MMRPGPVLFGIRALLCSALVLWVVDVVVNLRQLERVALGGDLHARATDFLALLVMETQVAAAAVLATGLAAPVLSALTRSGDTAREASAALGGTLSAVALLSTLESAWGGPLGSVAAAAVAAATGLLVLFAVRIAIARTPTGSTLGDLLERAGLPAIAVALASLAASHGLRGDSAATAVASTALAGTLATMWGLRHMEMAAPPRLSAVRTALRSTPVVVAALMALAAVVRAERLGLGAASSGTAAGGPARPDIVLVVLDTVRADHLARYGYARDTMPGLERWADGAMVAMRALSAAGWTSPSHASMLSGLPPSLHGIHYSSTAALGTPPFDGISWLPERLAVHGYTSIAVSANPMAIREGIRGFDRVVVPQREGWSEATVASLGDRFLPLLRRVSERLRWRMPYADAPAIVDVVKRAVPDDGAPLFLLVNFLDAHSPYNPPQSALDALGLAPAPPFSRYATHRELTQRWPTLPASKQEALHDLYDGELRGLDAALGELLAWIESRDRRAPVVIVTSDHGEELGESGRVGHEYGLAQALIHVPLLVRAPWLPAGPREEVVSLRALDAFIQQVGGGGRPGMDVLARRDAHGSLAERYRSQFNVDALGPAYDRSWVALVLGERGDLKVVGPSAYGVQSFSLAAGPGFHEAPVGAPSAAIDAAAARIDAYWASHRDTREEATALERPSDAELDRLRALGYVE